MRLKYLELYGFKSFAEKTRLTFEDNIVAIVGPNGSGKSNISDAIRWVLGEQSAKSLRGAKMEDVIFSGTSTKPPMNMAMVTIAFDNTDGLIDLPYNPVTVTRKVYRSGESEYQINKNSVRLKDIRELFMDTGVGKDGYSIIGQGRIEDILSTRSEDRRYIFEEASGISKFKYRKMESSKRLQKTEESLNLLKQDLKVKRQQADILKKQAENARQGYKLTQELERHELSLLKKNLASADEDLKKLQANLDYQQTEKEELDAKIEKLRQKMDPFRETLEEFAQERGKLQEEQRRLERKGLEREKKTNALSEEEKFLHRELERLEEQMQEGRRQVSRLSEESQKKEREQEEKAKEEENLRKKTDERKSQGHSLEEEYQTLTDREQKALSAYQEAQRSYDRANYTLQLEKKSLEEEEVRSKKLEEDRDQFKKQEEKKQDLLASLEEKMSVMVQEKRKGQEELETLRNQYIENRNLLRELSEKGERVRREAIRLKSEESTLQSLLENYEGFYRPIQALLKDRDRNPEVQQRMIGVLADLITVKDEYRTAINVLLGSQLQSIVVENEYDARDLIEYIKRKNLGRVTFLPLTKIKGGRPVTLDHPLVLCNAVEALQFDPSLQQIVEHFLGRTLIVRTIEDAMQLSKDIGNRARIVSLDGDVINTWGSMVGGKLSRNQSAGLLNRRKNLKLCMQKRQEAEKALQDLQSRIEGLEKEAKTLEETRDAHLAEIQEAERSYSEYERQKAVEELNLSHLQEKQEELQTLLHVKRDLSIEDLEESAHQAEEDLEEKQALYQEAKDERAGLDERRLSHRQESLRLDSELEILIRDRRLLENEKSQREERMEYLEEKLKQDQSSSEERRKRLEEIAKELEDMEASEKVEVEAMEENKRLLEKNRLEESKMTGQFQEEEKELNSSLTELSEVEKEIYRLDLLVENNRQKREGYYENYCSQYELDKEAVVLRLNALEPLETTRANVAKIKAQLNKIGYFHFEAIEQSEAMEEELKFLVDQWEDLNTSRQDLISLIADLDRDMEKMFKESFKKINEKFQEIFQTLFNGGKAELVLESNDVLEAGIEIIAQPPGKKLRGLGPLSGGERSLTAVALLFAIFEISPAPFCILDEIDASLDEANITRYVRYLQSLTRETQFIIITHRKTTMQMAQMLYGVTMEEKGISKVVPLDLNEFVEE